MLALLNCLCSTAMFAASFTLGYIWCKKEDRANKSELAKRFLEIDRKADRALDQNIIQDLRIKELEELCDHKN